MDKTMKIKPQSVMKAELPFNLQLVTLECEVMFFHFPLMQFEFLTEV